MKNKMSLLALLLLALTANTSQNTAMAKEVEMSETPPPYEQEDFPHRAPFITPAVDFDDAILTISSDYGIVNMQIIVRDCDGHIVYCDYTDVANSVSIGLSQQEAENAYSIELLYQGVHLIGYF